MGTGRSLFIHRLQRRFPDVFCKIHSGFLLKPNKQRAGRKDELFALGQQNYTEKANDGNALPGGQLRPLRSSMSRWSAWSSFANPMASASPRSTF